MTTRQYYWHIHHEILCEALTEPIQNRIDHIKKFKDPSEVETRLRCMTPVLHPERLPVEWTDVYAKLSEAYAKLSEASQSWMRPTQSCMRPAQSGMRPTQSWMRPAQSWMRPAQSGVRPTQSWMRPAQSGVRPAQSYSHRWRPCTRKSIRAAPGTVTVFSRSE